MDLAVYFAFKGQVGGLQAELEKGADVIHGEAGSVWKGWVIHQTVTGNLDGRSGVAKLWAFSIQFAYCAILTVMQTGSLATQDKKYVAEKQSVCDNKCPLLHIQIWKDNIQPWIFYTT